MGHWFGLGASVRAASAGVVIACTGGSAFAGDYHSDGTLACNECHVMHFSLSHGYSKLAPPYLLVGNPQRDLLLGPVNQLCASCHDGQFSAPDVIGINTGSSTAIRLGGFLNWASDPLSVQQGGHTLESSDPPPGGSYTPASGFGLSCIDCHDPHGRTGPNGVSMYRNLNPNAGAGSSLGVSVSYSVNPLAPDLQRDVWERAAAEYDESMVEWCEPDSRASAIARWCAGCHGYFHDSSTTSPQSIEHPVFGENLEGEMFQRYKTGYPSGAGSPPKIAWVKVMSRLGRWNGAAVSNDATPTCITCHKAHGNANPYGLIYRRATLPPTENGSGTAMADLCLQCHDQVPDFFAPGGGSASDPTAPTRGTSAPSSAATRWRSP